MSASFSSSLSSLRLDREAGRATAGDRPTTLHGAKPGWVGDCRLRCMPLSLSSPLSDTVIQIEAWRRHRGSKILAVVGHHGVLSREELCHRFLLMSAAERLAHSPTCAWWPLVPWLETTIVIPSMQSSNYSTCLLKPAMGRRFKNTRSHGQICMKENL